MKFRSLYRILLVGCLTLPIGVQAKDELQKYHEEITELSVDDNLLTPEIPGRLMNLAKASMTQLANAMAKQGLRTDLSEREGLVLMITMPVSELFAPNDTLVKPSASKAMAPILQQLRTPDKYKLLVTVHSDDTGTEEYLNSLTRRRSDAIVEWIAAQGVPTAAVIPYGLGYDEPLNTEASRSGRARNRRVEFYFVPGPVMIQQLKAGR